MAAKIILLLLGTFLSFKSFSQTAPAEGAIVNSLYTVLKTDPVEGARKYTFRIATSNYSDQREFNKHSKSIESSTSSMLFRSPAYNSEYTWQVTGYTDKKKIVGPLYHFKVAPFNMGDTNLKYRVRVLANTYSDSLYFFLDNTKTMYDLKGDPVWFLPEILPDVTLNNGVTDLKMSPFNTITFLAGDNCYETDFNGNVLWKTPDAFNQGVLKAARFHHNFTRLKTGNYMVLSSVVEKRPIPGRNRDGTELTNPGRQSHVPVDFGTILEYDTSGGIVWSWNSSEYFTNEDLFSKFSMSGEYHTRTHLNAFYFDEKSSSVYAGFRDISRIVKIKYPEKTILSAYNGSEENGERKFFLKQHSMAVSKDNDLYLFSNNNNAMGIKVPVPGQIRGDNMLDSISTLVVLREPASEGEELTKVWEFACKIDYHAPSSGIRGGNITELPDGNFFVCMGASNRVFIVNRQKEILFNALIERWDENERIWRPYPQYRASPVSLNDIRKLNRPPEISLLR